MHFNLKTFHIIVFYEQKNYFKRNEEIPNYFCKNKKYKYYNTIYFIVNIFHKPRNHNGITFVNQLHVVFTRYNTIIQLLTATFDIIDKHLSLTFTLIGMHIYKILRKIAFELV